MKRSISTLLPVVVAVFAGFGPQIVDAKDAHLGHSVIIKSVPKHSTYDHSRSAPIVHKHYAYVAEKAETKAQTQVVPVKTHKKALGKKLLLKKYAFDPYKTTKFKGRHGHVVKKKSRHHGHVPHKGHRAHRKYYAPKYFYHK